MLFGCVALVRLFSIVILQPLELWASSCGADFGETEGGKDREQCSDGLNVLLLVCIIGRSVNRYLERLSSLYCSSPCAHF